MTWRRDFTRVCVADGRRARCAAVMSIAHSSVAVPPAVDDAELVPRWILVGVAAVAVAVSSSSCGGVEKLSAEEVEQSLARGRTDGRTYECEPLPRGRWDYACAFTDSSGIRKKVDVAVNHEQVTRGSGAYFVAGMPPAPRRPRPGPAKRKWLVKVNAVCEWADRQAAAMSEPRTLNELTAYVKAFRRISKEYRRRLAALPIAPAAADRATFEVLLLHIKTDVRLATELLAAIRARDRAAIVDRLQRIDLQAAEENRHFARLGACPVG
jgi:hypothetical protein